MVDFTPEEQQRRDDLLLNLLKMPQQQRPRRDRGKPSSEASEKSDIGETPEPAA